MTGKGIWSRRHPSRFQRTGDGPPATVVTLIREDDRLVVSRPTAQLISMTGWRLLPPLDPAEEQLSLRLKAS
jgi:hypothetical protein